ncbi:flavodoxin family protein [Nocardia lasii]|uniref:Flavodoxin family protein n=1 Tax=Nocardia lasii TaxID=1616107 RepID=A0ABW1JNM3_9NOCA
MKTLLVCKSVSHGNTRRIADTIGQVLDARVVDPSEIAPTDLTDYNLVGFGSGIYYMNFHPDLRRFIAALPPRPHGKAFHFRTSGTPEPPMLRYATTLSRRLEQKGFQVLDTFDCRGHDTWLPLRLIGGISKGHPDATDISAASAFATALRTRVTTTP